uniref:Uncharacterized protein n=1 Tax=Anguilla anguilla TaxID=7936 RepID=A0A0E9SGL8_ANGAN
MSHTRLISVVWKQLPCGGGEVPMQADSFRS